MAVIDVRARCWLCNDAFNAADLTPTLLPAGIPLIMKLTDGRELTAVTVEIPVPLCRNCLTLVDALLTYKGKTPVS